MKKVICQAIFVFLICQGVFAQVRIEKPIPRDTSFTPFQAWLKIRKEYPDAKIVKPSLPKMVTAKHDLVYATLPNTRFGKRELHLDLFQPQKAGKYPALILIHGGGWRSGNRSMQAPLAMQVATRGYVTACIEYRLSPEALYPSAIFDIKAAIRFLRANAAKYDIDPDKIAISGSSAGGQLASLVGMTKTSQKFEGNEGNNSTSSEVQAIINMDGILDFTDPNESAKDTDPAKPSAGSYWFGATYNEAPEKWVEASPIGYAAKNTPPILFINSALPRFNAGRDSLISILNKYAIYSKIQSLPNTPHPFWLFHPWFEPTVEYMVTFLDKILKYDFVVAQDGTGDFVTIQKAIDACKAFPDHRITIFVKPGIYKEKLHIPSWNTQLSIIGLSPEKTIITYDDFFTKINRGRNSTFYTYTMLVEGNDFRLENITVENSAGPVGQAVALHVEGDRCIFLNCRFLGNQDTVYAAGRLSRQYFMNCLLEGTTDFIFGEATTLFEQCTIHCKADSYITAASTPEGKPFGFVFLNCKITAEDQVQKVYLGRPWRSFARVAFLNCEMGSFIVPAGWNNWSDVKNEKTVTYAEYHNSGSGANTGQRVGWSKILNQTQALKYTKAELFSPSGWEIRTLKPWYNIDF